jgi:CrcB protein
LASARRRSARRSDLALVSHEEHLPVDPDLDVSPTVRRGSPDVLAVIAAGGMLGASARYGLARWLPTPVGQFPWATFWTNISGSFVLGLALVVLIERFPTTRYVRPFLTTGILGAFTTMSTYAVETALLLKGGHRATGVAYALASLAAGLAVAALGMFAGRRVGGVR